jgi:hypothetical protein
MKHFGGHRFFVCRTPKQAIYAIKRCGKWYASALVDKQSEFRVFVCQGYVVAISQRFPANESAIAWNLEMGGKLINVRYKEWPLKAANAAILAAKKLGLDWAAIDVAIDKAGKPVVFEANTAPGLRNPYTLSHIAKTLVWTDSHPYPKPIGKDVKSWRSLIHPALKQKAEEAEG